ncbi:MAG: hypothetical protein MUC29_06915 [Pyrinomonadaceae bacterium]|nr:hypothetical protein [Pyrinomonadaceae bacterium]
MRFFCTLFFLLLFALNISAQLNLSQDHYIIEPKVEQLLIKHDVAELSDEFAKNNSDLSAEDFLIRLSVFGRAGHNARVRETLEKIVQNQTLFTDKNQLYSVTQRAISRNDLASRKIFHEKLFPDSSNGVSEFIYAWQQKGDLSEIEEWLKSRVEKGEDWWAIWAGFQKSIGKQKEVIKQLTEKIKANPSDFDLVQAYLNYLPQIRVTTMALTSRIYDDKDIAWLENVVESNTAYEAFEFANRLQQNYPKIAEKFYKKSLSLAYTEKDNVVFGKYAFRGASVSPNVKNPEKQLRYWTKKGLINIYLKTNQANLAQPIAEELVKMDISDIQTDDIYSTAGSVQAVTEQRVIENKILQDEATNENSPTYWLNRAAYYGGRGETQKQFQTYLKALEKFPYQPNNIKGSSPRLYILSYFRSFTSDDEYEVKITDTLRKELKSAIAVKDYKYIWQLINVLHDDSEELHDEFFTNTNLFTKAISTKKDWNLYDSYKIEIALESEKWNPEKKRKFVNELARLSRENLKERGFTLASILPKEDNKLAITLLYECLKIAPIKDSSSEAEYDQ